MAADGDTGFDMNAHRQTYSGVIGLFKWGSLATAIIVAFVIWLIAS